MPTLTTSVNPQGSGTITDETINGYELLDYIQSSGTQYIDTLFYPNGNTRVKCKIMPTGAFATNESCFGGRYSYTSNAFILSPRMNNNTGVTFVNYGANFTTPSQIFTLDTIIDIDFNKNVLYANGNQITSFTLQSFTSPASLILFGYKNDTTIYKGSWRFYDCKIFDNDELVRDYIPAKRISDSAIGMLDKVNNVFYANSGSGTFTYGQSLGNYHKVTAIPNSNYIFNNWLLKGYTQLEYIQSSGTQYIDTGLNSTSGYVIESQITPIAQGSWNLFYGRQTTSTGGSGDYIGYNNSNQLIAYCSGTAYANQTINLNQTYNFKHSSVLGDRYLSVDGNKTTTTNTGAISSYNIYLFGICSVGSINHYSKIRLHSFKAYESGNFVRDYIPVIRHSDGQIGLLDLIHFKFYGNSGSGSFVGGDPI